MSLSFLCWPTLELVTNGSKFQDVLTWDLSITRTGMNEVEVKRLFLTLLHYGRNLSQVGNIDQQD